MTVSTHTYTAHLIGTPDRELRVLGGRIDLDSGTAPHVRGYIEIAIPGVWSSREIANPLESGGGYGDAPYGEAPYGGVSVSIPVHAVDHALLDELDPRDNRRIRIVANATFPTFSQSRTFDLHLRARSVNRADGTVTLELASDEAMLEDYAPLADDPHSRGEESSLRGVVNYVLNKVAPGTSLEPGGPDADVSAAWRLTNMITNPNADTTDGFAPGTNASTLSVGTTSPRHGGGYVRWYAPASGPSFLAIPISETRVNEGETYTFNAYLRASAASQVRLYVRYEDSEGLVIGYGALSPLVNAATGTAWSELSLTFTIPAGIAVARPYAIGQGAAGITYAIDSISWYQGNEFVEFFSGSFPDDALYTYAWADLPNASPSVRVPYVERAPETFRWRAGQSAIDFLHPLLQAHGMRLVCDEQRRWTLRDENYEASGELDLREGAQIIDADDFISRDADMWFDARVTTYRWTDSQGVTQERIDAYALPGATRVSAMEVAAPYPGPGRSEYAVRRAQGRGREVRVETVSDWTAAAEMPLQVHLSGTPAQLGTVQSVSFDLDRDRMTVSTRTTDTPTGAIDLLPGTIDALAGTVNDL